MCITVILIGIGVVSIGVIIVVGDIIRVDIPVAVLDSMAVAPVIIPVVILDSKVVAPVIVPAAVLDSKVVAPVIVPAAVLEAVALNGKISDKILDSDQRFRTAFDEHNL